MLSGELVPGYFFGSLFSWSQFPEDDLKVNEKDGVVTVESPMTGIPVENIKVSYDRGILTAEGSFEEKKGKAQNKRRVSFSASVDIDPEKAEAILENGLLTIRGPKLEKKVEAVKIAVKEPAKKEIKG